jgi:hypothetical protein
MEALKSFNSPGRTGIQVGKGKGKASGAESSEAVAETTNASHPFMDAVLATQNRITAANGAATFEVKASYRLRRFHRPQSDDGPKGYPNAARAKLASYAGADSASNLERAVHP